MAAKVKLNRLGIAAILKSPGMQGAVKDAAEQVKSSIESQDIRVEGIPGDLPLPIRIDYNTTDRARASVSLAHPAGEAVQAKHGALTKAAADAGLEVRGK